MPSPIPAPGLSPAFGTYRADRLIGSMTGIRLRRYLFTGLSVKDLPILPRGYQIERHEADHSDVAALFPDATARAWRFDQQAKCLTVTLNDVLLGGLWLATTQFDEDEVRARYQLGTASAWDLGLLILPEHRATRAFAALWAGARDWLSERGLGGSISRISDYLEPSIRAHARLGGRLLGSACFICLGDWQYCRSSLLPGAHASRHEAPVFDFTKVRWS
jgi:hypothetical protein